MCANGTRGNQFTELSLVILMRQETEAAGKMMCKQSCDHHLLAGIELSLMLGKDLLLIGWCWQCSITAMVLIGLGRHCGLRLVVV